MTRRRGVGALAAGLVAAGLWASVPRAQVGDRADVDTAPPPAHWRIPPAPVRSPAESMRLMDLPPGFRIELVAAEPLVKDPIAFAFDERNRLWVLEWPAYNWPLRDLLPGLAKEPPPPSRLVVLRDTDGDGRMDERTLFASMDFPRGIQLVAGGVLVYALPEIVFLRDDDGDGTADNRQVIASGLPVPVNPHLAPSSPSWTLDNWTYGLQVDDRLRLDRGGAPLSARSGRLAGQWGMSHDDYGRLFFSYNQDHIRGSLVPTAYATRNPHYTASAGIDVRIGLDNDVWPHAITAGVNRRAQLRDDGRLRVFTANASPAVYRGDKFPADFRGNVFVVESAGRLIRRSVLTERDGIITGRNAYDEREFLFSHDERFRPVYAATGPDGTLHVADMYRGIIEGHIFLTTFLRNQIVDRGLQHPFHGMGRIYRIVHEGHQPAVPPPVAPGDTAGWVPLLAHGNGHWRDMAQRMLVGAGATSVVPAVRRLATSHADARVRLHALWTLDGLGAADADLVRERLRDDSPHVRIAALRIAEAHLADDAVRRAVLALVDDDEVAVRRQVMYTLGASTDADAYDARVRLVRRDVEVPFVVDAFMSGLAGRERDTLDTIARSKMWAEDQPGHRALVTALATAVSHDGSPEGMAALRRLSAEAGRPAWLRDAIGEGIAAAERTATARAASAAVTPRDPAMVALVEQGRSAYAICAACHQADGRGLASIAPPLAGAASVTGAPEALIDIVLRGRDVDAAYPNMPPLAGLSDEQLAAILTYVRQAWGNAAPAVAAGDVRARRHAAAAPPAAQASTPPDGFMPLFNGRDLAGWRGRPGKGGVFSPYVEAAFSDEERRARQTEWDADRDRRWWVDAATGDLVTDGLGVHLATARDYGDFELLVDWKLTVPNGVTGIYLRSYPQVQLWDPASETREKTGAFRGSGALWNNADDSPGKWPLVKADRPIGEWNHLRVRMVGARVWVWLNGQQTVDGQRLDNYFDRSQPLRPSGAIELQSHGTEVRFRNIFIRELDAQGR